MHPRAATILILAAALMLTGGCGVAAGLTAPIWGPIYAVHCLGGGAWCKPLDEGVVAGTLRLENDAGVAFLGLVALGGNAPDAYEISGEADPLPHGHYVDVLLPAGVWREVRVRAADGTLRTFFDVIVPPEETVTLRLE